MQFVNIELSEATTRKPVADKRPNESLHEKEREVLLKARDHCIKYIHDTYKKLVKSTSKRCEVDLRTEEIRASLKEECVKVVNDYARVLIEMVTNNSVLASSLYYYWSTPFEGAADMIVDDYRFDLYGVYYNLGVTIHEIASEMIRMKTSELLHAQLQKEAYHMLREAVSYINLSQRLLQMIEKEPLGISVNNTSMRECIELLTAIQATVLAEAQEIGCKRAADLDPKSNSDTAARLAHRIHILYAKAKQKFQSMNFADQKFKDNAVLVEVKSNVFYARTCVFAGAWAFHQSPETGLWYLQLGETTLRTVNEWIKAAEKSKIKVSSNYLNWVQLINNDTHKKYNTLNQINAMVHRAKVTKTGNALPPAQILAIPEVYSPPVTLPLIQPLQSTLQTSESIR